MSIDQENVAAVANTAFPESEEPEMKKSRSAEETTEKPQEEISAEENEQQVCDDVNGQVEGGEVEDATEGVEDDVSKVEGEKEEVEGDKVEVEDKEERGAEIQMEQNESKDELIEETTE